MRVKQIQSFGAAVNASLRALLQDVDRLLARLGAAQTAGTDDALARCPPRSNRTTHGRAACQVGQFGLTSPDFENWFHFTGHSISLHYPKASQPTPVPILRAYRDTCLLPDVISMVLPLSLHHGQCSHKQTTRSEDQLLLGNDGSQT